MAYCAIHDVLGLLPEHVLLQLADDQNTRNPADPGVHAVLAEAIEQADREIDSYAGVVRAVPLSPVPALVSNLAAKLAVHNLWLRRPGVEEPEEWQRETAHVRRMLEQIALGRIALGDMPQPEGMSPAWSGPGRVMDGMQL